MIRVPLLAVLLLSAPPAMAGTDFGTRAEAETLARDLVDIIETTGLVAAAQAVMDPDGPFRRTRMGVNLFNGSSIMADNREPETVATDYREIEDLEGDRIWPKITVAADRQDDALLLWYHYDTQVAYEYHCYTLRADRVDATVMVCR